MLVTDHALAGDADGDYDRRIDQPSQGTALALRSALQTCCDRVITVSELGDFTRLVGEHLDCLVFPYWFGQRSRSRHGLVPAICEANGVMFVGADAFTKIVCNDKELSKTICRQVGLPVPASGVVRRMEDLRFLRHLRMPLMVKPNYEGTSLGITDRNKCSGWEEAAVICGELLQEFEQPVIVEEFIAGREFSSCLMHVRGELTVRTGAWTIEGRKDYLDDRVFSAGLKTGSIEMAYVGGMELPRDITDRMKDCFRWLGKVDVLRIDGRLREGCCSIIELTPDAALGPDSEFAAAYGGVQDYDGFVSRLIMDCVERYRA